MLPRIVKGDFANSSICWFFKKIGIIPADEIAESRGAEITGRGEEGMNRQLDAQYSDGIAKAARAKIGLFRPCAYSALSQQLCHEGPFGLPAKSGQQGY